MKLAARYWDFLVPAVFAAAVVTLAPLRTAFELSVCEGYELMKGYLFSLGYWHSPRMWNDQPPFHTLLLGLLFRIFGPTVYAARLLQVAFAALLVWSFYKVSQKKTGRFGAFMGVVLLVSTPPFIQLSCGTMLELPAMALALASFLAWQHFTETEKKWWLVATGCLMGCALQTKLTVVIFLPALLIEYFGWCWRGLSQSHKMSDQTSGPLPQLLPRFTGVALTWLASVLGVFAAIALVSGERFDVFWKSHFSSGTQSAYVDMVFESSQLLHTSGLLVCAFAGFICIIWNRRWQLLSPIVFFITVLLVHKIHHPYWGYYFIHFCIALAWLASTGFGELFALVSRYRWTHVRAQPIKVASLFLIWSALLSLVILEAPLRLKAVFTELSKMERVAENSAVKQMVQYRDQTRWAFTDRVIYAFHAGVPVPPELAVIPEKRVWSGEISSREILKVLQNYGPEQIVIFGSLAAQQVIYRDDVLQFIEANYVHIDGGAAPGFYLLKPSSRSAFIARTNEMHLNAWGSRQDKQTQ